MPLVPRMGLRQGEEGDVVWDHRDHLFVPRTRGCVPARPVKRRSGCHVECWSVDGCFGAGHRAGPVRPFGGTLLRPVLCSFGPDVHGRWASQPNVQVGRLDIVAHVLVFAPPWVVGSQQRQYRHCNWSGPRESGWPGHRCACQHVSSFERSPWQVGHRGREATSAA